MSGTGDVLSPARRGFSLVRQFRLIRKEWAETLRDRRTLITLVLMPLLVYPLLSMVFRQFLLTSYNPDSKVVVILGVPDKEAEQRLLELLRVGHEWLQQPASAAWVEPAWAEEPALENLHISVVSGTEALQAGAIDLLLQWQADDASAGPSSGTWRLTFLNDSAGATSARSFVERRLRAVSLLLRRESSPPVLSLEHTALERKTAPPPLLPTLVPLVLLMMTITGAVYPAIDVTAGERERGTLEALVAAPVSRHELLLAKYVAVLTVALLTAVVNLVAMFTTISAAGLGSIVFGHAGLSLWLGVQLGGLLLLFASFFSAVLLAITSFARSFREAQAYLIPLMLLTLGPGLLSLSPALELTGPMALLPLMNVVLLARDLFLGTVSAPTALVVVVTTLVYAALAIGLASRIFGSDAILPGSTMSWRAARTSGTPRTENLGAAAMVLSIAMAGALQSTLGPLLLRWGSAGGTAGEIGAGALGTLGIFLGIPIVAGSMTGTSLRRICRLNWADLRSWLSATLLGLGSGVLVIEVTLRGQSSGWLEVSEALREALQMKSAALEALPLACVLFCLALIPALAEECFFRGLVQSGCQRLLGGTAGMFLTALTFAIFHVVSPGVLLWERFFPSFTLGLLLGALAWSARSTWPGVWLHAINNAGLLLLARYKAELVGAGWLDGEAVRLPWLWLAGAAATTITGVVLLKKSRQHPSPVSSTP